MELLRAASLDGDPAVAAWQRWLADFDVDTAYHRSTDLLPAVSANLHDDHLADEAARLRGVRRHVWAKNQLGFRVLGEAVTRLRAVGVDAVVVKGAALATSVYAEPGTRAMHDVDLWVGPQHLDDACAALLDAGWTTLDAVAGPFYHAVAVVHPNGSSVDVHRSVVFPRFSPVEESSWWDRSVDHCIDGVPMRRLASSDELVLSVLHGLLTNSSSASRWPVDVVMIARHTADQPDFWSDVVASSHELEVGPVVADGLAMCLDELDAPIDADVVRAIREGPVDRGLAIHWAACRRGITPEWRFRRYSRIERAEGRRPSVQRYVAGRTAAFRARGVSSVVRGRVERVKQIVADRTRD